MSDNSATTGTVSNSTPESEPKGWRDLLPIHPAAELFPLMGVDELRQLADDIQQNGLSEAPVLYDGPDGVCVIDGRNRLDALELIGGRELFDANGHPKSHLFERQRARKSFDPLGFVLSKNLHRRHLTAEQKRELIAKLIKVDPSKSDRQIAKQAQVSKNTAASVRTELEGRGQIDHVEKRTDSKGRKQPARKSRPVAKAAVERKAASSSKRVKHTHITIIEAWDGAPPEDRTKAISSIGRKALMAALPQDWIPLIVDRLTDRQEPAPTEMVVGLIPDDLSTPPCLQRVAPVRLEEVVAAPMRRRPSSAPNFTNQKGGRYGRQVSENHRGSDADRQAGRRLQPPQIHVEACRRRGKRRDSAGRLAAPQHRAG
jgi:hypothetical protein